MAARVRKVDNFPRCMNAAIAAEYCGVSPSTFLSHVGTRYPKGTKVGRNRLWFIEDLDKSLDRLKEGGEPLGDPDEETNEWLKTVREA